MREFFIWNVRLNRNYAHQTRFLARTDQIVEALPYAEAWASKTSKDEGDELSISMLECEGSILVPNGLDISEAIR